MDPNATDNSKSTTFNAQRNIHTSNDRLLKPNPALKLYTAGGTTVNPPKYEKRAEPPERNGSALSLRSHWKRRVPPNRAAPFLRCIHPL